MTCIVHRSSRRAALAALATGALTLAPVAHAQSRQNQENTFTWVGTVPAGRSIMIRNVNGAIHVEHSGTGRVEVTAEKHWRRGRPEEVLIQQPHVQNGDVLICALWNPGSTCDESGIHSPRRSRNDNNDNDVSVEFVVRVPDGVRVDVSTVNGGLDVSGATDAVRANTVNGSITARSSGGPVEARTVNGSITVSMRSPGRGDDLDYSTVNGSVTLEVPSDFGAQLELSTVNGRVSTDFPITVVGTLSPRSLRGTIGNGAARVRAGTVNGSVALRRSN